MIKKLSLILLACLCLQSPASAQDTIPNDLCIDVNLMMPQRYPSKPVTDFSLCLKGDTVVSRLPYLGQAHRPTYSNADGLNFKLPISEKSVKAGKKNRTIIKFTCKNSTSTYDFMLEIYPDGGAYIKLTPSHSDQISYKGEWK